MIDKLRFYTSLILARMAFLGIKTFSKSEGTSFAGMIVFKFYPKFLTHCKNYIKEKSITVTGTNGKTTTSGLISHIIENANQKVIHNPKGANMLTGIINVFALNLSPFKSFDYAVIEADEAYLTKVYDYMAFDYLVVTNLFRDQLDRYGEISTTANYIKNAISKNPKLKLVLNADDPLVSTFNTTESAVFYGFEDVQFDCNYDEHSKSPSEIFNCTCNSALEYNKRFFAQQGHYYCPKCGYQRPKCDYSARAIIHNDYSEIKISNNEIEYDFRVNLVGLYNAYNALAAISLAFELGLNQAEIQKALNSFKSMFGRAEKRTIEGRQTLIQLIKNPTGASEVLKTVDLNSTILIAINDEYADGRDMSWLWDSNFEKLKDANKKIIVSGKRANDVAVRLKYAGVDTNNIIIEPDIEKSITRILESSKVGDNITILPSYTALLKINKLKLKK